LAVDATYNRQFLTLDLSSDYKSKGYSVERLYSTKNIPTESALGSNYPKTVASKLLLMGG
jgi:hypothetical protein